MIKTIIQVRLGSTRLPGKVLKEVCGKPLLQHIIERLDYSKYANDIIIATTTKTIDDKIVELAKHLGISVFRGSESDVLDRYFKAAKEYNADVIVRITSDCPLIDPKTTDRVIKYYTDNEEKFDFVSNVHERSFPDGLDTEVFPFKTIQKAWKEATDPYEREHVTPYIWGNPHIFRIGNVYNRKNLQFDRWTLDYEEDFNFIKSVYENLYSEGKIFLTDDILRLLEHKPEIRELNAKYRAKSEEDLRVSKCPKCQKYVGNIRNHYKMNHEKFLDDLPLE